MTPNVAKIITEIVHICIHDSFSHKAAAKTILKSLGFKALKR